MSLRDTDRRSGPQARVARLGRGLRAAAALLALVVLASRRRGDAALLASGACLLCVPLLLQAPVAALNAQPLGAGQSVVEVAMQSRLYYMGVGGIAAILAIVFDRVWRVGASARRVAVAVLAACAGIAVAAVSREDARAFAERTARNARLAHAAVAAVDALDLPPPPCHVVFLDLDPPAEWSAYVSMDAVVKAIGRNHARSDRCWFHANYPTWFFLLPTPAAAADAAPYEALRLNGREVPWLAVGGATAAYLQAPRDVDAAARARMRWLRWNGERFDDVGADAARGRVPESALP